MAKKVVTDGDIGSGLHINRENKLAVNIDATTLEVKPDGTLSAKLPTVITADEVKNAIKGNEELFDLQGNSLGYFIKP